MSTPQELEALLAEMVDLLEARDLGPVDLYLLGGCSLILYDDRVGAAKDLDVVEERL